MPRDDDAVLIRKWASMGDVATPESQGLKRSVGWPASYSPPGDDAPQREVFNQKDREVTGMLQEINERGILVWDARLDYVQHARVMGSDGEVYRAVVANGPAVGNTENPVERSGDDIWIRDSLEAQTHKLAITSRDYLDQVDVGSKTLRYGFGLNLENGVYYPIFLDFAEHPSLTLDSGPIAFYNNEEATAHFYAANANPTTYLQATRRNWTVPPRFTRMRLSCGVDFDLRSRDGQARHHLGRGGIAVQLHLVRVTTTGLEFVAASRREFLREHDARPILLTTGVIPVQPGQRYALLLTTAGPERGALTAGELSSDRIPELLQGNQHPAGIFPDAARGTLWVANNQAAGTSPTYQVFPYNLTTGASLQSGVNLSTSNDSPQGIAVTGDSLYVGDLDDRMIYKYRINGTAGSYSLTRVSSGDILTNRSTGSTSTTPNYTSRHPVGDIWIEGTYLWCINLLSRTRIYCYDLTTRLRVPSEEVVINPPLFGSQVDFYAVWKDGDAFWVGGADEIVKVDKDTGQEIERLSFGETESTDDQLFLSADANYLYLSDWRRNGTGEVAIRSRQNQILSVVYPAIRGEEDALLQEILANNPSWSMPADSQVGGICVEFS